MTTNRVEALKIHTEERRDEEGRDEKGGEKDFWRKHLESCAFTLPSSFTKLGTGPSTGPLGELSVCPYKEQMWWTRPPGKSRGQGPG